MTEWESWRSALCGYSAGIKAAFPEKVGFPMQNKAGRKEKEL